MRESRECWRAESAGEQRVQESIECRRAESVGEQNGVREYIAECGRTEWSAGEHS